MAATPIDPGAKPKARKWERYNPANVLADAAIARLRRVLPKNFGVNLGPRSGQAARPSTNAKLKAFARELLSTRLDRSGARIRTLALGLFVAYAAIGAKLLALGLSHDPPQTLKAAADDAVSGARPDLLDRNGAILATDVKTMSVFAEPNRIIDIDEAVELITAVLPDVDAKELRERLASKKGFIWVKRQITPKEQAEIFHLGLPGVGFLPENKRVYPNGPIGAHVIGFVDKDNVGIAGMEKYLDEQSLTDPHVAGFTVDPASLKPVRLSLDLKATHALRAQHPRADLRLHLPATRRRARGHGAHPDRGGHGTGAGGARPDLGSAGARIHARLRSQRSGRRARSDQDQPHQCRRLRNGLDLQGAFARDGARIRQGQSRLACGRARQLALRAIHDSRFSRHPSRADGAGSVHPFLEHRRCAAGADGWH